MITAKLENSDFGARQVKIKTEFGSIKTPSRGLISTETHYIDKIINSGKLQGILFEPYPHEIYEVVRKEHPKHFRINDLPNEKYFKKKLDGLKTDLRFQKDAIKLFNYQKPHPFYEMTVKNNLLLAKLQMEGGLKLIKVWETSVTTSPQVFGNQLSQFRENLEKAGLQIMPVIEMANPDRDNFQGKWKILQDMGIEAVCVTSASVLTNWQNYSFITEFLQDKDMWVHASEVPRKWKSDNITSESHLLQKFGINSTALEIFSSFLKKGKISVFDRDPHKQKLFDQYSCGLLSLKDGIKRHGKDLNCSFVCCKDKTRETFYTDYAEVELLPLFANVHEAFNSFYEMQESKQRIQQTDFKNYIKEKYYLNHAVNYLTEKFNVGQKSLDSFF